MEVDSIDMNISPKKNLKNYYSTKIEKLKDKIRIQDIAITSLVKRLNQTEIELNEVKQKLDNSEWLSTQVFSGGLMDWLECDENIQNNSPPHSYEDDRTVG